MTLVSLLIISTGRFSRSNFDRSSTNKVCRDLAKFIAGDRISCTIDRVNGIIETNRPDDKNKQYADVVKQGDALITKLQKYGQAVRLRGSERG